MKHFVKPLGHYCLTTAVMTSAVLRIYALPAVEAATPTGAADSGTLTEAASSPTNSTHSTEVASHAAAQAISPPERIAPVVVANLPQPADAPAATETNSQPDSASRSVENPAPAAPSTESLTETSTATATSQPAPAPVNSPERPPDNNPDNKPESSSASAQPSGQPESKTPAATNPVSRTQTVTDMRQLLEKRLAAIVQQDKASKEAAWQQNLVLTALQLAWSGQFEQARQMAAQPALPPEVQTELLAKIAAIETLATSPIAQQQPNQPNQLAQASQKPATGRVVPSGSYSVISPGVPSYASLSLGNQCPVPTPSTAGNSATKNPGAAQTGQSPSSISALAQNLVSQLVQLSRTQSVASINAAGTAKDVAKQPLVASQLLTPQLFTGVALSAASQPTPTQAAPSQSRAESLSRKAQLEAKLSESRSSEAKTSEVTAANALPQPQTLKSLPAFTSTIASTVTSSTSAKSVAPLSQAQSSTAPVASTLNVASTANFGFNGFNQMVGSALNHSLEQLGVSLWQIIPDPLNFTWNWWDGDRQATDSQPVSTDLNAVAQPTNWAGTNQAEFSIGSLNSAAFATGTGLSNSSLIQPSDQNLASGLKPLRDARKLSIPTLSPSAATKPTVYDTATLLAMSCTRSQLAHYDAGNYTVDPTTSKRLGWINLMFPLPIPAVITSAFGWRIHPITGNLSFHTGLDMGAPMGTPVLAALSGRVVVADYMGGYGMAVVVENDTNHERNLYGHLSGIAVQPGMQIKQGAILGWVGSTGNSTGPHLHFESQIRTENGWTAVDPLASAAVAVAKQK